MKRFSMIAAGVLAASFCAAGTLQSIVLPLDHNVYSNANAMTSYTSPKVNGFVEGVILTATNTIAAFATNDVHIIITANGCGVIRTITSNNVTGVAGKTVLNPRVNVSDIYGVENTTNHVAELPLASETVTIKAYSILTNCDVTGYLIIYQP
jgi:hypothetical protein